MIEDAADEHSRPRVRDMLGSFLFGGEAVEKKIKVLSGGERARVALCKLLLEPVNLLVMDEPTNHLDMKSKDILKSALNGFDGTLIIVSHDRDFLQGLTEKVYEFKGQNIKEYLENNNTLTKLDLKFLKKISKKYRTKTNDKHKYDLVIDLLQRVDVIPNSIVLAQAANESGWGTSRFATEYNALFGEYTYNYSDGVVPLLREEGEKHLVKTFDSVDKSVQSYFINLNSHHAYSDFRKVRKIMREKNNFNNIKLLVQQLDSYAADKNYIKTINSIIDANKLNKFDTFIYSINNS